MTTVADFLAPPTNGHARLRDADFTQLLDAGTRPAGGSPGATGSWPAFAWRSRSEIDPAILTGGQAASGASLLDEIEAAAPLPRFPIDVLPPRLRAWVDAAAEASQTDPAAAALLALAVSSAALAGRVLIASGNEPPQPLSLLVGLQLDGADRGDSLMAAALRPLRELEFAELAEATRVAAEDAFYREQAAAQLADLKAAYKLRPDETYLAQILPLQADLASAKRAALPRRIIADGTPRALERQLGEQGRAACFAPQGNLFRRLAGRGGAARDRLAELLAEGHAGGSLAADLGGGRLAPVRRAEVTCAVLFDASLAASFAAQRQPPRALFARFLFAAAESRVGKRSVSPPPTPTEIEAAYRAGIERMARRAAGCWFLSPTAAEQLAEFRGQIERELGEGGRLASIRHWGAQLGDQTLRLAGLLHAWSDNFLSPISEATVAAAIALARWLVPQAARILRSLGLADDDCSPAERAALRLARSAGEFSSREAMQRLKRTFLHRQELERTLARLVRRGYLGALPAEAEGTGRPPTARFAILDRSVELAAPPADRANGGGAGLTLAESGARDAAPVERAASPQKSAEGEQDGDSRAAANNTARGP